MTTKEKIQLLDVLARISEDRDRAGNDTIASSEARIKIIEIISSFKVKK